MIRNGRARVIGRVVAATAALGVALDSRRRLRGELEQRQQRGHGRFVGHVARGDHSAARAGDHTADHDTTRHDAAVDRVPGRRQHADRLHREPAQGRGVWARAASASVDDRAGPVLGPAGAREHTRRRRQPVPDGKAGRLHPLSSSTARFAVGVEPPVSASNMWSAHPQMFGPGNTDIRSERAQYAQGRPRKFRFPARL